MTVCLEVREQVTSPGCPGTHFVDQAGLKLTGVCQRLLGIKVCTGSGTLLILEKEPFMFAM